MSDDHATPPPPFDEQTVAAGVLAGMQAEIDRLTDERIRALAEVDNVRKRAEKQVADERAYGASKFARDILSVADNLSRALDAMPAAMREEEGTKPLVIGLEATQRELSAVFERNGITRIAAIGLLLDPNQHQAMVEIPSDAEPGTIVQEMQAGYMIKDRLLRPALVGVAKKAD